MDWIREMEAGMRQQRRGRVREIAVVVTLVAVVSLAAVWFFALN